MWIAVGNGTNAIAYSYDGISWTGITGTTIFTTSYGITWNGNMWVVVGNGTHSIAYSYNGLNWFTNVILENKFNYGNKICYNYLFAMDPSYFF
jgi:hypothetical protein